MLNLIKNSWYILVLIYTTIMLWLILTFGDNTFDDRAKCEKFYKEKREHKSKFKRRS